MDFHIKYINLHGSDKNFLLKGTNGKSEQFGELVPCTIQETFI